MSRHLESIFINLKGSLEFEKRKLSDAQKKRIYERTMKKIKEKYCKNQC